LQHAEKEKKGEEEKGIISEKRNGKEKSTLKDAPAHRQGGGGPRSTSRITGDAEPSIPMPKKKGKERGTHLVRWEKIAQKKKEKINILSRDASNR